MIAAFHPQTPAMEAILVERNRNLIWSVVNKYRTDLEKEDLYTEGVCGLLHAARRFDARKGCKFSTTAVAWIRQNIGRAVEQAGLVRVPTHCYTNLRLLRQAREELGPDATEEELCTALGWGAGRLENALLAESARSVIELDAPVSQSRIGEESNPLLDFQVATGGDPAELVAAAAENSHLASLIEQLPPRVAQVLRRRLSPDEPTFETIGLEMGLTRERVRQIESKGIQRLKFLAGREMESQVGGVL